MDKREDILYSLIETCRSCLKNAKNQILIPIFEKNTVVEIPPIEIFEEFSSIKNKICRDDGLPQHICVECMERLNDAKTFRIQCENSYQILEKYFNKAFKSKNLDNTETPNNSFEEFEFLSIENIEYDSNKVQAEVTSDNNSVYETEETLNDETEDDQLNNSTISESEELTDEENEEDSNDKIDEFSISSEYQKNDEILQCSLCDKTYKREAHLIRHISRHRTTAIKRKKRSLVSMHVCQKCGKRFTRFKGLEDHENENQCISIANPKCRYCKENFTNMLDLDKHLKEMHPIERPHMCPICKKTFQSVSNRNTHLQSHNKEDSFKCDICGQGFKSKVYLNKHKKSVHTVSSHECPHCFLKFDNTVKYEYHLKSHDPNKKYKCKFCDKSFLQHHHLSNHERTHTGLRPYLCNICGKDFKQECNFKLHLRIHSGVRPYVCNVCGKDFTQRGSFVMHMRQHTGIRPYQCEHCGKDFVQKSSLNVHLRTHTGERPFKCESCDKAFVQAQQLKYHKHSAHGGPPVRKIHETTTPTTTIPVENRIYPYTCPLCNKGFKIPSSLSSHMKVHTEDRKHLCTQCGNSFKRAEHLRIHINGVHLKQKPYSCELCHKTFAQSGDRNIHMRRHTGEKPHTCTYCNKSFRLLKALRAHSRIHTGEKPYSCEFCKKKFMTYTALATHTTKHEEGLIVVDQQLGIKIEDKINSNITTEITTK